MKNIYFLFLFLFFCASTPKLSAQINFSQSNVSFNIGDVDNGITSMMFGPDGRLYVAEYPGLIKILTIQRNSATDYVVSNIEILDGIQTMEDHNDDGSTHNSVARETTGIAVGGTPITPIFYVASSDYRVGAGTGGGNGDVGLDTNSGVITRFSWNGSSWDVVDIVRGLPRSEENHATNGLEITTINGVEYLVVASGGHTNGGAPGTNFVYTCEYALSAAILSVNLDMINSMPILNDNGRQYIYDLPTLDDPTRPNVNGIIDPDDVNYDGIDENDPWGGNDGLNMAIIDPVGPVQILSPGYRNAYDIVVTESGALYATDNGANGGWGGLPHNEGGGSATNQYLPSEPGSSSPTADGEQVNNVDHLEMVTNDLSSYVFGSFYAGHPTPIRANPTGAGLYTDDDVNQVWRTLIYDPVNPGPGYTDDPNIGLPANWPPVQVANPVEGDWRGPGISNPDGPDDVPIVLWGTNTNGIDEYTATNFGGIMQGNLLAGTNGGVLRRVELNPDGTASNFTSSFLSGIGGNALGVTCNSDTDIFPGTVWAGTLNGNLVVFEPQDFLECIASDDPLYDPLADYDFDGYTNQDEVDNGTDPCNGGSQPDDFDKSQGGILISDLNDDDDDFDGILDSQDAFQLGDPGSNGTDAFTIPIQNDLFNDQQGLGGIFGLGMTGLMNNGDTNGNWLNWIDRRDDPNDPNPNDVLGGAPGIMTSHMTSGTALGITNNQEKGYQYGVQTDVSTGIFTITGGMNGFTGPLRLYGNTAAVGGELGFFIGDGTQSNYIKFVVTTDGFTAMQEIDDIPQTPISIVLDVADRPANGILFYFVVDPSSGQVDLEYSIDSGVRTSVATINAQGTILNAIQQSNSDLAVGFIGTSGTAGVELEGSWDFLSVLGENPFVSQQLPNLSVLTGSSTGDSIDLDLYFGDDLGVDNLVYTLEGNTNAAFGAVLSGNILDLSYPTDPGTTLITLRATDGDGLFVEQSFQIDITSVYYRINSGGPQVTYGGDSFDIDSNFTGGGTFSNISAPISELFQTERSGTNFSYNLPLPAGEYRVNLYFSEIYFGANNGGFGGTGQRVFDVDGEGIKLLDDYDIWDEAGAQVEVLKSFDVAVSDGELNLIFDSQGADGTDQAKVSAIEVLGLIQYPPISIDAIADQSGEVGDDIGSINVVASGGDASADFIYDISGQPLGISIDSDSGVISGIIEPEAVIGGANGDGIHQVTVTVNKLGSAEQSINFLWTVTGPPLPFTLESISDLASIAGDSVSFFANATGGDTSQPVVYSMQDAPSGVSIDDVTGEISGIVDTSAISGGTNNDGINLVTVIASRSGSSDVQAQFFWTVTSAPIALVRINSGGVQVLSSDEGPDWEANDVAGAYTGTNYSVNAGSIAVGNLPYENRDSSIPSYIDETTYNAIFAQERFGAMEYSIPISNGDYTINLYVGNSFGGTSAIGQRVFGVEIEGVTVGSDIDLVEDFGHQIAAMLSYPITVYDGLLNIEFINQTENPLVNAIEILGAQLHSPVIIEDIVDQFNQVNDNIGSLGVNASGGDPTSNFAYDISGQPQGISIEPTNGLIFGTIEEGALFGGTNGDGIHEVVVTVDKPGSLQQSINFNWSITGPLSILPIADQNSSVGNSFSFIAIAAGGDTLQPIVYGIDEAPDGISIDAASGEITGEILLEALNGGVNGDGVHQTVVTASRSGSADVQTQFAWTVTESTLEGVNLALGQPTVQSSEVYGGVSSRAVDGVTEGSWFGASVTHTATSTDPWWRVDLGQAYDIEEIQVYNRSDSCCSSRLDGAGIYVGNIGSSDPLDYTEVGTLAGDGSVQLFDGFSVEGQYVLIFLGGTDKTLHLAEVEVYGSEVNAVPVPVTGVSLTPDTISLEEGDSTTLTAVVSPLNADDTSVLWASDDDSVATVTGSGLVNAVSIGTATISVTTVDGGFVSSSTVTVTENIPVAVTGVSVSPPTISLSEGSSTTLVASVVPLDADDTSVLWSSDNEAVATVGSNGLVNAISIGTATISATTVDGGFVSSSTVTVTESTLEGVNLALGQPTVQSSEVYGGVSGRAVDGVTGGNWFGASVTHTATSMDPWWRVDLGQAYDIEEIQVYNRSDSCCSSRLDGAGIYVGNIGSSDPLDYTLVGVLTGDGDVQLFDGFSVVGQYVLIFLGGTDKILHLAEVEVYGSEAGVTPLYVSFEDFINDASLQDVIEPSFKIFPNPASHIVYIESESLDEVRDIKIFDSLGRMVKQFSLTVI